MRYAAPTTTDEVRALLGSDPDAIVFAGATDVVPQMRGGRPEPSLAIDLKKIDRLMAVSLDGDTWRIGAAAPVVAADQQRRIHGRLPGPVRGRRAHRIRPDPEPLQPRRKTSAMHRPPRTRCQPLW